MLNNSNIHTPDFIPSAESRLFSKLFGIYTKWLFKFRFKDVWIQQEYQPKASSSTVYFLNHTSWWDGIIPLLLNENLFHQRARAMMDHRQMRRYPFFKYIGAFSVDRQNPRSAITSLRFALNSIQDNHSCLFIYPQGKIVPEFEAVLEFESGIGWLYNKCEICDFVPIAISTLMMRGNKPDLYLKIGKAVDRLPFSSNTDTTRYLQTKLTDLLNSLHDQANTEHPELNFNKFI